MELNNLRALLQKYEDGETSLDEEKTLKQYFNSSEEVPEEFLGYKKLFNFIVASKNMEYSKEIYLNRSDSKKIWAYYTGAAGFLLVIGFLFFNDFNNQSINEENLGTIEDPEQAYIKTKETLQMVANVFNDGREDLEYLHEFNKTKNKFIKKQ